MENNNFKSFKYVVGNDFIYKDKVVVKVFFIHDYKNFLRTIDIKKKNGANDSYYIAEAKKIVKQELDSGKLLKASKRCVNAFAKGLAITTAVVVGISAVGVGGFYTYKYITETQQHNIIQNVVDEIDALNANSTLQEITKAKEDYDRLNDTQKEQVPEETKKHLDEQIALYQKDVNAADKFETDAAELDGVTDSKKEIDSIVAQENALTTRAKTLIKAETFTKVTQAVQAYKKDAARFEEFKKIAGNLSDKSSNAEIKRAEDAIETVKDIQHADLLIEINKITANIEQQRVAYDKDKKDVDDAKTAISALAAEIKTCTKVEIDEGNKNLAEAVAINNRRQGDFKDAIDAMKKSMNEIESAYQEDEAWVEKFTGDVEILSEIKDTCTGQQITNMEKEAQKIKEGVLRSDFAEAIANGTKTIQTIRELYEGDKTKVEDFYNYCMNNLDGETDTEEEIADGYVLMQAAQGINRDDLKEKLDAANEKYKIAADNFVNDQNAAEDVIELITDIETEDELVLNQIYVDNISTKYAALNTRSKGMADAESIEKWDKNVTGRVADLQQALTDAGAINLQLMGLPSEAAGYTNDNLKFQLLSIAALYDNLDVPTQKAITLENRAKIALRSEIGLNNAYSFTSLNGSGIATEPKQHIYWDDNYGYYVKGTLIDNAAAQILSLDASTVSTIKSKFSSIKFCASVTSNETGDPQTLSIKSNGDTISNPSLTEALTLIEVSTADLSPDGTLEFIINNSNGENFDLTFLYGVPNE